MDAAGAPPNAPFPDAANIFFLVNTFQDPGAEYADLATYGLGNAIQVRGEIQLSPNLDQPGDVIADLEGFVVERSDHYNALGLYVQEMVALPAGVAVRMQTNEVAQAAYVADDMVANLNPFAGDRFVLPINLEFSDLGVNAAPGAVVPASGSEVTWSRYTPVQACPPDDPAECWVDIPDGGTDRNLIGIDPPGFNNLDLDTDNFRVKWEWATVSTENYYPALWGEIAEGIDQTPGAQPFIDLGNNANSVLFEVREEQDTALFTYRAEQCDAEPALTYYDNGWYSDPITVEDTRDSPESTDLQLDSLTWDQDVVLPDALQIFGPFFESPRYATFNLEVPPLTFDMPMGAYTPAEIVLNANNGAGGSIDCVIRLHVYPIASELVMCADDEPITVPEHSMAWIDAGYVMTGFVNGEEQLPVNIRVEPIDDEGWITGKMMYDYAVEDLPDGDYGATGWMSTHNLDIGEYNVTFVMVVDGHVDLSVECTITIHVIPLEPPGYKDCDGSVSFYGRRFVRIEPVPSVWAAHAEDPLNGTFDFSIASAKHNDVPLPGPGTMEERLEAAGIITGRVVYSTAPGGKQFFLDTTAKKTGHYQIELVAYSTISNNEIATCIINIYISAAPAPVFISLPGRPSPCSSLTQELKVDMIEGLPSRIKLTAETPMQTKQGTLTEEPPIHFKIEADAGPGSSEWIVDPGWATDIAGTLEYTAPGEGQFVYNIIAENDDRNRTVCKVGFNAMEMTWTASVQSGSTTYVIGNDRGNCVPSETDPKVTSNGRAVFKIKTEDMEGQGPYTEDLRDLMQPRALAAAAKPDVGTVIVAGGGYPIVDSNGECRVFKEDVTHVYSTVSNQWREGGKIEQPRVSPFIVSPEGVAQPVIAGGDRDGFETYRGFRTPTATQERWDGMEWNTLTESKPDGLTGLKTMPAGLVGSAVLNGGLVTGGTGHPQVPVTLVQHGNGNGGYSDPMIPYEAAAGVAIHCSPAEVFLIGGTQGRQQLTDAYAPESHDNHLYDSSKSTNNIWRSSDGGITWSHYGDLPAAFSYLTGDVSTELGIMLVHGGYGTDGVPKSDMFRLDCNQLTHSLTLPGNGPAFTSEIGASPIMGLPPVAAEHASAFIHGQYYIAGGIQPSVVCMPGSTYSQLPPLGGPGTVCPTAPIKCQVSKEVVKYDPITKIWMPHDEIPTNLPGIASMGYARDAKWGFMAMAGGRTVQGNGCYEPVDEAWAYYPFAAGVGPVDAVEDLLDMASVSNLHTADLIVSAANSCPNMMMKVGQGGLWFKLEDLPEGLISPTLQWWNNNADLYLFGGDESGKDRGNSQTSQTGTMDMRPSREVYVMRNVVPMMLAKVVRDADACLAGSNLALLTSMFPSLPLAWGQVDTLPLPVIAAPSINAGSCIYILGGHHAPQTSARLIQVYRKSENAEGTPPPCDGTAGPSAAADRLQRHQQQMTTEPLAPSDTYPAPELEFWKTEHLLLARVHHAMTNQPGQADALTIAFGGVDNYVYGGIDGEATVGPEYRKFYSPKEKMVWGNPGEIIFQCLYPTEPMAAWPIKSETLNGDVQLVATGSGSGSHRLGTADWFQFWKEPCPV